MDEPNCTVACIERNDDIYCNPRCDLPQELKGDEWKSNTEK